jgi:hypothetical protein
MFGAEFSELLLFTRQLGLALTGAAALWGFVFVMRSKHQSQKTSCVIYEWIGAKLLLPLTLGVFLALISWFLLLSFLPAFAHEGIVLIAQEETVAQGNEAAAPAMLFLAAALALAFLAKRLWPKVFQERLEWFFALHFALALLLMALFSWQGEWSKQQLFFWGHSIHSITTVGTVLVLDFLFLISKSSSLLKQHIYPLFPTMSKAIWVGLGVDFLSVALVFQQAIQITPKFFFMQTVVAVLIINGVLLAGPITRKMLASVKKGAHRLTKKWERIGGGAGVISIASWGTITLVDFFEHLTLNYFQLLLSYLSLIVILFLGHLLLENLAKKPPALLDLPKEH